MNVLNKIDLNEYKPLRDIVFETLREAIMNGNLKPGERLMEVQLAQKLGVSRTPVREAIRKLELEGIITMIPRKGAYVAEVSLKDISEVLEVRAALEGLAAGLAAEKMLDSEIELLKEKASEFEEAAQEMKREDLIQLDVQIHEIIFKSTNNHALMNLVDGLREQVQRFRITYLSSMQNAEEIIIEHRELINALIERNPEKAKIAAESHIKQIRNFILTHLEEPKER